MSPVWALVGAMDLHENRQGWGWSPWSSATLPLSRWGAVELPQACGGIKARLRPLLFHFWDETIDLDFVAFFWCDGFPDVSHSPTAQQFSRPTIASPPSLPPAPTAG